MHRYQDFDCWKLAEEFKTEVFALVKSSSGAWNDWKFRSQLVAAARAPANDIVEGFLRRKPRTFAHLLDCAIASLGEAERHLHDGIALGYFTGASCDAIFRLARRCMAACRGLKRSQLKYAAELDRNSR